MDKGSFARRSKMTVEGEMITLGGEMADFHVNEKLNIGIVQSYTLYTTPGTGIIDEKVYPVPETGGTGFVAKVIGSGMCIAYSQLSMYERSRQVFRSSEAVVQMYFAISSPGKYGLVDEAGAVVSFDGAGHNLFLFQPGNIVAEISARAPFEALAISLTVDTFMDLLPGQDAVKDRFQMHLRMKSSGRMMRQNLPLTPKMAAIIYDIAGSKYGCNIKALFLRAKIMELLALQLEQYEESSLQNSEGLLKKEDVEKIYLAREIMLEDLSQEFTLKGLARQVGTNEFNLKKHFKIVFGKTVFGYLHEYKMETSRRLITETGEKIGDVATQMGYKYPSHFTAAFRKYFGFLPKQVKQSLCVFGPWIMKLEAAALTLVEVNQLEMLV